jgi:hypothetical protein
LSGPPRFKFCIQASSGAAKEERRMGGLIYLIGLIVVIMAVLSLLGLR